MDKVYEKLVEHFPLVVAFIMAIWGGTANYISRVKADTNLEFAMAELMGEWVISGFSGVCMWAICQHLEVPETLAIVFVAIAGHQGSRSFFIIEMAARHYLKNKIGK